MVANLDMAGQRQKPAVAWLALRLAVSSVAERPAEMASGFVVARDDQLLVASRHADRQHSISGVETADTGDGGMMADLDFDNVALSYTDRQLELAKVMLHALELAHKHDWRPGDGPRAGVTTLQARMEAAAR
jgi:hypothetical protein